MAPLISSKEQAQVDESRENPAHDRQLVSAVSVYFIGQLLLSKLFGR